jgi:hypothetical protein
LAIPTQVRSRSIRGRCLRIDPAIQKLSWVALVGRYHHADPPHALRLLRRRSKWPSCRAAEKRDELAPHQND